MKWGEGPVRVRVPATSANLGPGYDTLGLALALYDEVEARVTSSPSGLSSSGLSSSGLSLSVSGEGAEDVAGAGEKHLVVRAMRAAFESLGTGQPPGIELRCVNHIPHGRGLGSSAAAITAGILAARALAGASTRPEDALSLATAMEGHPDNVAPCLYGGLTIAWLSGVGAAGTVGAAGAGGAAGTARAVKLTPLPQIRPVVLIAPAPVSTEVARGLLPDKVTHADAAVNAGRAALLVAALTACPDALLEPTVLEATLLDATEDRLHQDYRATAMPATADLVRRLRAAGVPAVVSGAGPSVLAFRVTGVSRAFGGSDGSGDDLDKLDSTAKETGIDWRISPLDIERQGASVTCGVPDAPVVR
jgi:homoserine kinase